MKDGLLFRIAIQLKETDKRKNATVYRYVVLATTLDEAKTLAVAAQVDRERAEYHHHRLENIAAVWGHAMHTLACNCDIYGEKDKTEKPDTVPTVEAVRAARQQLEAFEQAHEEVELEP